MYLQRIRFRTDSPCRSKHADMTAQCNVAYAFHRRADNPQHPPRQVKVGQIIGLYAAQSLCRCRIASQDDKMTSHFKKLGYRLQRKLIHNLERTRPVGRARIIAQIHIVISGQYLPDFTQNSQSAITRIKHADGSRDSRKQLCHTPGVIKEHYRKGTEKNQKGAVRNKSDNPSPLLWKKKMYMPYLIPNWAFTFAVRSMLSEPM